MVEHGRLQAAEGKIELRLAPLREPARKIECARIPFARQPIDVRPARIRQPEQLGHLIEGLPRSVIQRVAERAVLPERPHFVQRRVPARDDQTEPRRRRRVLAQEHGQQMPFDVVDARERQSRRGRQGLAHLHADEQRADQTRPARHGEAVEIAQLDRRLAQRLVDHRQHPLQVIARGQLRHDAAEPLVHLRLRMHHVRQRPCARPLARRVRNLDHRRRGLVAARLDAQHAHGACVNPNGRDSRG